MNRSFLSRRWMWLPVGVAAVATMIVVAARPGFSKTGPIWTDRPVVASTAAIARGPWVELAKQLKPAVVNISTKRVEQAPHPSVHGDDPFDQFFQQFFGNVGPRTVRSLGSGFIINASGYVVTNNHVVDGASEIRVKLSDGREVPATVVGRDAKTDLALLKIPASGLPVVPLGDSTDVQVGEPVMAIGNPFGLEQTVTTGIVSAKGRVIGQGPYDDFIQTDASINPGNSGGPLINARGQAIGINSAIYTTGGGSNGIGFAIPISLAKPVLAQIAATGHVVRGWLGVQIQPVTADLAKSLAAPDTSGALVASVVPNSPAMKAGIKGGDIIVDYDGRKLAKSDALPRVVADTPVGRDVPVTVLRDGKKVSLTVKVAKLAEPERVTRASAHDGDTLGLAVQPLDADVARGLGLDDTHGLLVRGVEDSSRAANAGLEPGDVIVEIDHHPVTTVADLQHDLRAHPSGSPVLMLVHRHGASLFVAVG